MHSKILFLIKASWRKAIRNQGINWRCYCFLLKKACRIQCIKLCVYSHMHAVKTQLICCVLTACIYVYTHNFIHCILTQHNGDDTP